MSEAQVPDNEIGAGRSSLPRTNKEFLIWLFGRIRQKKKWWLLPLWALLAALAIVLFLTGNGALLPAIYLAF